MYLRNGHVRHNECFRISDGNTRTKWHDDQLKLLPQEWSKRVQLPISSINILILNLLIGV